MGGFISTQTVQQCCSDSLTAHRLLHCSLAHSFLYRRCICRTGAFCCSDPGTAGVLPSHSPPVGCCNTTSVLSSLLFFCLVFFLCAHARVQQLPSPPRAPMYSTGVR